MEVPRSPPRLLPKHTIFLNHSGQEKPFVEQLCKDLEAAKLYPFFDQERDSLPIGEKYAHLIFEAAKQCLVAVVVLSPGYMESKWPMLELVKFHKAMKAGHPIKFVPLFYKLTPDDLREPEAPGSKPGHLKSQKPRSSLQAQQTDQANKEEVKKGWAEWKKGWQAMKDVRNGEVEIDEHLCEAALRELKKHNGLLFARYKNSEYEFRKGAVNEIGKLAPPAIPFDTSDIHGCDRLCKAIADMFVEKQGIQYLGVYGNEGSGKSTLCGEAMCSYFQKEFQGRFCRVELEFDADSNRAAAKKREARMRQAIQQLVGLDKKMAAISNEAQLKHYLQEKLRSQNVFLVVDNVAQSSRDEAEFYVKATTFPGSKVLVTSRNQKVLEAILGGAQYCKPMPGLRKQEASHLVLSKAAKSKLASPLEPDEEQIVEDCVAEARHGAEGSSDEEYHPLVLRTLATHLRENGEDEILSWTPIIESLRRSDAGKTLYRLHLLQYEKLDKTSKLVFLDLAIFADGLCLTHEDFRNELEYGEHNSFKQAVTYIALLHGITLQQAIMKVKMLQKTASSFVNSADTENHTEIWVPQSYVYFARWLIDRDGDREEKNWCMVCKPEGDDEDEDDEDEEEEDEDVDNKKDEDVDDKDEDVDDKDDDEDDEEENLEVEFADLPNVSNPSKLVRASVTRMSLAYSDHLKIRRWRYVAYLELIQVSYLRCLDLQGLHSLRVLRVDECDDLEKIVCTCDISSPSDTHLCYENPCPDPLSDPTENRSASSTCLPNLRFVQLEFLTALKHVLFPMHCWNLETLWFYACPNLASLPDLRLCKKLKKLRLPCGDFQGFQGLRNNQALTELGFDWDRDTVRNFTEEMKKALLLDMTNLTNLTVLDVVAEDEPYEWIPADIRTLNMTRLVHLTFLDLSWATTIEEVKGLEHLSHLTALGLYGCCELRTLPDLALFKDLKRLCIGHCHNLELTEDEVPFEVEDFHLLGESCAFGEHECLDPDDEDEGICKLCKHEEDDQAEVGGDHEAQMGGEGDEEEQSCLEDQDDDQAVYVGWEDEVHTGEGGDGEAQSGLEEQDEEQAGVEDDQVHDTEGEEDNQSDEEAHDEDHDEEDEEDDEDDDDDDDEDPEDYQPSSKPKTFTKFTRRY